MTTKQWAAVAGCGIALWMSYAYATKRTSSMAVSVQVKPITVISTVSQPATFTVSKDDIKAGAMLISQGGAYAVTNNDRAGYKLIFSTADYAALGFSGVTITSGLAQPIRLAPHSATSAPQPYTAFKATLQVSVRIVFNDTKDENGLKKPKPGTYPWPVLGVAIEPL